MIASIILVTLVLVLHLTARPLLHSEWTERSPRVGILMWQALVIACTISILLAALALAVPRTSLATGLADLLRACAMEIQHQYTTPAGAFTATAGLAVFAWVSAALAVSLCRTVWTTTAARRRHRRRLDLLDRDGSRWVLLDHDEAIVYCVPGKGGRVVTSRSAAANLSPRELDCVLMHERAHLRMRHDLALGGVQVLARALPFLPLYRMAAQQIAVLVEMDADDAVPSKDRRHLASALLQLGVVHPVGSLGAGGTTAFRRAQRLLNPAAPLRPVAAGSTIATALALVAVPVALALMPGGVAILHDCCVPALAQGW